MFNVFKTMRGFFPESVDPAMAKKGFYELKADLPGKDRVMDFEELRGKPVLIVNTASKCSLAPQYAGLEELHKAYSDRGLQVLGFPSNDFAGQEPGSDEDIAQFCQVNHGVTFPLMKKSEVNGDDQNQVFAWLKASKAGQEGGAIKWNFTKFLINREGQVVGRYGPKTVPEAIKTDIEKLL